MSNILGYFLLVDPLLATRTFTIFQQQEPLAMTVAHSSRLQAQASLKTRLPKQGLLGLLALAVFLAAYFPALQLLVGVWMQSEEYAHAFLALPIIFYMVWLKKEELMTNSPTWALPGLTLAILATFFYLFALLTQVQSLIFLSLYATIIGSLVYLAGANALLTLATPLFLLLLLMPVPEQLYTQLTFPLQLKVSQASEFFIRLFDIPLLREGNIMHHPHRSFEVVDACSGMRSVISLATLGVVMGYFILQRLSSKILFFAASIPIAIFVNIARIVAMILLFHYYSLDLTEGALHTASGLLVFALALIIFFFMQRLLVRWETKKK